MKKFVSLLLAALLLLSASSALAEFNTIQWPLIGEGDEQVTLTVAIQRNNKYAKIPAEESWFWNYLTQYSGIQFELTTIPTDALNERKSLMFASDELPDILLGLGLSTTELVKYGVGEGQLLPLEDYITEEIMPNLTAWMEAYPEARPACTAPDGHMYTLPCFSAVANAVANTTNVDINIQELQKLGLETPKTLDEFIQAVYAFKKANPDSIPVGYSKTNTQALAYLMRAFGFVTDDGLGVQPALRNGQVTIPVYDDVFGEYLKLMHQFYEDGILSQDMYTTDEITMKANAAEGKNLVFPTMAYIANPDKAFYSQWNTVYPLSSEYCDKGVWKQYNTINVGGTAISADTEYPELCCRLLDFFWSDFGGLTIWQGPMNGTEETLGMIEGWTVDDAYKIIRLDVGKEEGQWGVAMEFVHSHMGGWSRSVGNRSHSLGREDQGFVTMDQTQQEMAGKEVKPREYDMDNGDQFARYYKEQILPEFITPGYPAYTYLDEETAITVADLNTVITTYAEAEVAKFITGARSLDEFAKFQEELRIMKVEELLGYYQQAYADYQSALQ